MTLRSILDILLNNLLPVFLAAATGYVLGRTLRPDVKAISRAAFYIFSPCLVFKAVASNALSGGEFGRMALFTLAAVLASGALGLAACRLLGYNQILTSGILLSVMFVNGGNFGLPINLYAFGEAGLARATLYYVFSTTLVYTLGVYVASRGRLAARQALLSVLKVPALYALPLAGLILVTGWKTPLPLQRPIDLLAGAALPTMLVILGMQLARARWQGQVGPVGVAASLRLLGGPLIGLLLASLLGLSGPLRQAAVLESAMPTAVINTILAVEYEGQPDFVTSVVLVTTLLSPLILAPLIAYLKL